VHTHTDFNGKTTTYAYNSMNQLLSKTPDASFNAPAVTYTYNSHGQRQTMVDVTGTTSWNGYDDNGHVTQLQKPQGFLGYTYDAAGNLTQLAGLGNTVNYTYDALNRLWKVQEQNTGTTIYGYDNVGNLQTVTYPNGVVHTYTYDTRNRLTNLGVTGTVAGAPGAIASYAYTLDASGHRTRVTELSGRTASYGYDNLYRLTSETIASDPNSINGVVSYVYDSVGNRTQKTSTLPGMPGGLTNYNANDQLSTDTYDADGNTTASNGNGYVYDFENHLVQQGAISIVYDGEGNRVSKTAGGVTTKYLVDTQNPTGYAQVVYETFTGGTGARELSHSYVYGLERISEQRLYFTGSQSLTQSIYYVYDGHGSVRALTNPTGAVTDTYDYDAFGNLIHSTGTTPNNYLFASEQFDPDLGLYYNRARYLNTATGRFWSMDTFEGDSQSPLSLHRYLYASLDPIDRVDPSGQFDLGEFSISVAISGTLDAMSAAYIHQDQVGADFWNAVGLGFLKGATIGAATFGLGTIALKAATPLLRSTFEPIFAAVGDLERISLVGQSGWDEVLVRMSRFFLNTNKAYPAVGDTTVGRILQKLFPDVEWQMHHIFVQQAWSRGGSAAQIFENVEANEGLRRIGNGLWNLIPIPGALNNFLGRSAVASGVFATLYYGSIVYGADYFYSAVFE
jgi:RHS repeat-associated protein